MFWFATDTDNGFDAAKVVEEVRKQGAAERPLPIVEFVNHYLGGPIYHFEISYTKPAWDWFFGKFFHTTAENVFGPYTPDNAVPWYTIMFVIACFVSLLVIWILRGKLSEDEPTHGQQTLETAVLAVRQLVQDIIGPHGMKYFPVVATFGVVILISNLLGLFPGLKTPTASTCVTFALGLTSFVYYNYIGIKENGLLGHLRHFAGPALFIAWMMFPIELVSNLVRPLSLGMRLFGNMLGDEKVGENIALLHPPLTFIIFPALLMVLNVFTAVIQTLIFILLSMVYIGEVSHPPHDEHDTGKVEGEDIIAPVLT